MVAHAFDSSNQEFEASLVYSQGYSEKSSLKNKTKHTKPQPKKTTTTKPQTLKKKNMDNPTEPSIPQGKLQIYSHGAPAFIHERKRFRFLLISYVPKTSVSQDVGQGETSKSRGIWNSRQTAQELPLPWREDFAPNTRFITCRQGQSMLGTWIHCNLHSVYILQYYRGFF